jgi:tRNA pseudouridine13 synthase
MKIRQRPEDFVVVELSAGELSREGPFSIYRLEKWDIGTVEAVRNLARHWKVPRGAVSFAGLKDRHARTEQRISIRGGPPRDFQGSAFRAVYLGRSRDAVSRASLRGNRFRIVVRDLATIPDLSPLRRWGVPNYFDDQRFGSLRGTDGEFVGRALVRGETEKALRLAIASPAAEDRKRQRALKTLLRDRWGDWKGLVAELPPGPERAVAAFLADRPGAFGFAFEQLDPDLRILMVSAYQSWLWNRTLAGLLRRLPDTFEVDYAAGRHVFWKSLPDADHDRLAELSIPLLTPSSPLEGEAGGIARGLLAEEGVEQRQFRLKQLKSTFFGKGLREALIAPSSLEGAGADDELNRGRRKLTLSFELPKGSYATIVLKRLWGTAAAP